jgi:hypothetical protein
MCSLVGEFGVLLRLPCQRSVAAAFGDRDGVEGDCRVQDEFEAASLSPLSTTALAPTEIDSVE